MRPSLLSSSSPAVGSRSFAPAGGFASLGTTFLLALIILAGPLILGGARLWSELPLQVGVAFLFLVQGMRLVLKPPAGVHAQLDAIDLSVLLFALYAIGRWLTSPTEYFSRIEALNVVTYAGIFYTCRYGLTRRRHGLVLLFVLIALGIFETGFGYYLVQYSNPDDVNTAWRPFGSGEALQFHYYPRWLGTYGCPNHYGFLLVMATGAALALACFSRLAWPIRIMLFYLAGMMLIGVMYSASRGSWLAALASIFGLLLFGLRHGTLRWWVPVTAAVALILTAAALFSLSPEVQSRVVEAENTIATGKLANYVRFQLAFDALRIAKDNPVFGTGPATFVFIHPRYQSSTFGFSAVLTHDDYLNCLDDYGLVGFGLAMLFIWLVTLKFFQTLHADNRWQDRAMIAAAFAAWVALAVHSTVDFNMHIPGNALMFFALVGLGLGRFKRGGEVRHWSTISLQPVGQWLGWSIILLSLLYGLEAGRTAIGDIVYEQTFAKALDVPVNESIRNAEEGLSYDPGNAKELALLGDLYRYKASRQQDIEGRVEEGQKSLDMYRRALAANQLDDTVRARMGRTFDIMRRYSEAFFCYKTAVSEQPYNGEFWFWLGNHYWERGMLEKALEAYTRSTQCPFGSEESGKCINDILALPGMQGTPAPDTSANPLVPPPPHVYTTP